MIHTPEIGVVTVENDEDIRLGGSDDVARCTVHGRVGATAADADLHVDLNPNCWPDHCGGKDCGQPNCACTRRPDPTDERRCSLFPGQLWPPPEPQPEVRDRDGIRDGHAIGIILENEDLHFEVLCPFEDHDLSDLLYDELPGCRRFHDEFGTPRPDWDAPKYCMVAEAAAYVGREVFDVPNGETFRPTVMPVPVAYRWDSGDKSEFYLTPYDPADYRNEQGADA